MSAPSCNVDSIASKGRAEYAPSIILKIMIQIELSASWALNDGQEVAMDAHLLDCLNAVNQAGTLGLASQQLGISARTLRTHLRRYETAYQVKLIESQGCAGVQLSPAGRHMLWSFEQARHRIQADLDQQSQQLNQEWGYNRSNHPWCPVGTEDDLAMREWLGQKVRAHVDLQTQWLGSVSALSALHRGEIKLAGCQMPLGSATYTAVGQHMHKWLKGSELAVIRVFKREVGWLHRPSLRKSPWEALTGKSAQLINRGASSGLNLLLDAMLGQQNLQPEQCPGYYHQEPSELAVASSIAARHGDLGLATRSAALRYQLAFQPVCWEDYVWVCHADDLNYPAVAWLCDSLLQTETRQLFEQHAHDTSHTGQVMGLDAYLLNRADA